MASRDRHVPNGNRNDWVILAISLTFLALAVWRSPLSAIVRSACAVPLAFISLQMLYVRWVGRWKPYDPTWLVELANEQVNSEGLWLVEALQKCRMAASTGEYIYFLNPRPSHKDLADAIHLHHPRRGEVVLHLTASKQIACVELRDEYLDAVLGPVKGRKKRASTD